MRVGVLGSMVWDRIDHPDTPTVERWGGIAYSLAAGAAALPDGWTLRPIVKVGRDLAPRAREFLEALPGLETPDAVMVVEEPNNRVHLRYRDAHHRHERLTGGVPAWRWDELAPHLHGLDGLFVNLISGFELELETAERVRDGVAAPVYADLHSLLLAVGGDGLREPRPLARPDRWLAAFDVVQVNERELALVGAEAAERAVARGLGALLITLGPAGARWAAAADRPFPWRTEENAREDAGGDAGRDAGGDSVPRPLARGEVLLEEPLERGDPTGCGDVWGVTCFLGLLRGERLTRAMAAANRAAARNVAHRGADGLYRHLREEA